MWDKYWNLANPLMSLMEEMTSLRPSKSSHWAETILNGKCVFIDYKNVHGIELLICLYNFCLYIEALLPNPCHKKTFRVGTSAKQIKLKIRQEIINKWTSFNRPYTAEKISFCSFLWALLPTLTKNLGALEEHVKWSFDNQIRPS